jgi:uncharacterized protein YrzB (UPF0473 family)
MFEHQDIYTLTDVEGNESQFELLASAEIDGIVYLALEPMDDNPDDSYVILKLVTDENGEEVLVTIDDDDEFDRIADMFEDEFMTVEYPADEE